MKHHFFRASSVVLGAASLVLAPARASFTEVNLTPQANADIQTYTGGSNYQLGGTTLNVAGVPFALGQYDTPSNPTGAATTGVVQSGGGGTSFTFSMAPNTYATEVYTLMNTAWGSLGTDEANIIVTGSHGETATLDLVEGQNIRDHFNDGFVNTLTDGSVVSTYFSGGSVAPTGTDRLDRQSFVLPSTFSGDTISSITFKALSASYPNGAPFLAGLTLANSNTVPDVPSAAVPVLAALALLMAARFFEPNRTVCESQHS